MQPDDVYQKQVMAFSARLRRELAGEVVAQEKQISPARRAAEARRAESHDRRRAIASPAGLRGSLRQEVAKRSDTTTLKALAKKGVDTVTVLPMRAMEAIVREAVDQALAASGVGAGAAREQLAEDARRRLSKLLRSRRRAQQAAAAEERRRRALEERVRELTQQFQSAQAELSDARDAGAAVANPGVQAAVREVLEGQGLGGVEIMALEAQLTSAIRSAQAASRSEKEELLEKRLVKLNRALEESEQALRRLASMKSIDLGVASVYDSVQGLSLDDCDAERKKELLAEVFAENCELQLGESMDVEEAAALAGALPVPAGFEAPLELACSEAAF